MAIQTINDALPNGDTPRDIHKKINENFSNESHAASRLVGVGKTNVPVNENILDVLNRGFVNSYQKILYTKDHDLNDAPNFSVVTAQAGATNSPNNTFATANDLNLVSTVTTAGSYKYQEAVSVYTGERQWRAYQAGYGGVQWTPWQRAWSTANTKKDSKTNLLLDSKDTIPSTSAASRLVGTSNGNLVEMESGSIARSGVGGNIPTVTSAVGLPTGAYYLGGSSNTFNGGQFALDVRYTDTLQAFRISNSTYSNRFYLHAAVRAANSGNLTNQLQDGVEIYHTGNVTKDGNGFLKASSPVVDLYDDRIELNNDAEKQGVELVKNGTGDYTLKTKTGLRSDNTWQIEVPQDNNKNPLLAVDIDAKEDGTINIKCYKRIFSMETFLFGPDFNEPMDITEGRFISVRLNDNPEPEQPDEPEPEEEPIEDEVEETEVVDEPEEVPEVVEEEEPVVEEPKD